MSFTSRLKATLTDSTPPAVSGTWQPISLCLDDTACEFLNVGVVFSHGGSVEVRMLDSFERLKCLYDTRIDKNQIQHLLMDIEETLRKSRGVMPAYLSDTIRLGQPLFAQGDNAEAIVDEFFMDVVTLARPRAGKEASRFHYRSTSKLRVTLLDLMAERLNLQADTIIQAQPYRLGLNNGKTIDVDVPLLSGAAVGSIVSAWYKSPMVVENNILQATSDLNLVASNSRRQPAMSVLIPSAESGLDHKERRQIETAAHRKLERFERAGGIVLRDNTTAGLAEQTIDWWAKHSAA